MSDINQYSLDNLPSEVTVLPMSSPEDVLEKAEGDYREVDDHVYASEDSVVLGDIYGEGQTIDKLNDAIEGGAETFNLVGLCAARNGTYEPGDIVEPEEVHGVDTFSKSTEPQYVRETEEFPSQGVIDGRTKHASVPAVHHDASDYVHENEIDTIEMETAAALLITEGGDQVDLSEEKAEGTSVSAAFAVFDTFEDELSQDAVWDDSEITFEEAYERSTEAAARAVDQLP